jgi:hypothetical protein
VPGNELGEGLGVTVDVPLQQGGVGGIVASVGHREARVIRGLRSSEAHPKTRISEILPR